MQYKVIEIKTIASQKETAGKLSIFEAERDVPFQIRRIYYIFDAEVGTTRGFHAHIATNQLLFCPYGEIEIVLDDGFDTETVCLNDPSKGLLLLPGLWRQITWKKKDSVLCVAASEYYNEDDYIRSYEAFKEHVTAHKNGGGG